jgi:hypothetical protein
LLFDRRANALKNERIVCHGYGIPPLPFAEDCALRPHRCNMNCIVVLLVPHRQALTFFKLFAKQRAREKN